MGSLGGWAYPWGSLPQASGLDQTANALEEAKIACAAEVLEGAEDCCRDAWMLQYSLHGPT